MSQIIEEKPGTNPGSNDTSANQDTYTHDIPVGLDEVKSSDGTENIYSADESRVPNNTDEPANFDDAGQENLNDSDRIDDSDASIDSEYSDIGEKTDTAFPTPDQIESDYLDSENVYYPNVDLQRIQIQSYIRSEAADKLEYLMKTTEYLNEYITRFSHITENCDSSILNNNSELHKHLKKADTINYQILINPTVELYQQLMDEYEDAYVIAPCSTISLQLARPYGEVIIIYPRDTTEHCNQIFEYGIKGIGYYQETLSYTTIDNEDDGDILYRIGQIYHYLGDIPNLDNTLRIELYQTAACYFDIADNYVANDYYGYTNHYAGMVYHKLGVISGEDNATYLLLAIDRYEKALKARDDYHTILLADNYKFRADVYERLAAFVKKYGQSDILNTSDVYAEHAKTMRDRSVDLK